MDDKSEKGCEVGGNPQNIKMPVADVKCLSTDSHKCSFECVDLVFACVAYSCKHG